MPEKSAIEFLILACVIISWPLRMPPSRRPMITSTMAISTSVKPCALSVVPPMPKKSRRTPALVRPVFLQRPAECVDVRAGLFIRNVARGHGSKDVGVLPALLAAHAALVDLAVIHLRVERDRHLVRNIPRAHEEAAEAAERGGPRRVAGLYADHAGEGIEGLVEARAGDEA